MANTFGDRLHDLRTAAGLSAMEVSIRIGCSERAVHCWEAGKRGIQARHLARLAKVLRVSMDDLYLGRKAA